MTRAQHSSHCCWIGLTSRQLLDEASESTRKVRESAAKDPFLGEEILDTGWKYSSVIVGPGSQELMLTCCLVESANLRDVLYVELGANCQHHGEK